MKKINKNIFIIITTYALCLLLTGCSKTFPTLPTSNEIQFSDDFEEIYNTLLNSTYSKSNLTLIPPKSGEHNLIINTITDNFSRTFAVVFYKNSIQQTNNKHNLRMAIFQKSKNDGWTSIANFPCPGHDVDKILFAKNKNNSNYFLVVGYLTECYRPTRVNKNHKHFYVYNLDPRNCNIIPQSNRSLTRGIEYCDMALCDVDNSGSDKLVYIAPIKNVMNNQKQIFTLDFQKDYLYIPVDCPPPTMPHINNCKIQIDTKSLNQPAIFVDVESSMYEPSNKIFYTYVMIFDNNRLKEIYKSPARNFSPYCMDFDNDGCLEIPTNQPFRNYSEKEQHEEINIPGNNNKFLYKFITVTINHENSRQITENIPLPVITNWLKLKLVNGKIQTSATKTYTNLTHGYGFVLPPEWEDNVYAQYLNKTETVEFLEFDENRQNMNNKLLTITCSNKTPSSESLNQQHHIILQQNGPFSFLAKIPSNTNSIRNKKLIVSAEQLKNLFFLLK